MSYGRRPWWVLMLDGNAGGAAAIMAILKLGPAANVVLAAGLNNDLDPGSIGTINRIRFNTNAGAASLSGIVAGSDGQLLWLLNTGTSDLTLLNANAGSAAANQFSGLGDIIIPVGGSALIYYDTGVSGGKWVIAV